LWNILPKCPVTTIIYQLQLGKMIQFFSVFCDLSRSLFGNGQMWSVFHTRRTMQNSNISCATPRHLALFLEPSLCCVAGVKPSQAVARVRKQVVAFASVGRQGYSCRMCRMLGMQGYRANASVCSLQASQKRRLTPSHSRRCQRRPNPKSRAAQYVTRAHSSLRGRGPPFPPRRPG